MRCYQICTFVYTITNTLFGALKKNPLVSSVDTTKSLWIKFYSYIRATRLHWVLKLLEIVIIEINLATGTTRSGNIVLFSVEWKSHWHYPITFELMVESVKHLEAAVAAVKITYFVCVVFPICNTNSFFHSNA